MSLTLLGRPRTELPPPARAGQALAGPGLRLLVVSADFEAACAARHWHGLPPASGPPELTLAAGIQVGESRASGMPAARRRLARGPEYGPAGSGPESSQ